MLQGMVSLQYVTLTHLLLTYCSTKIHCSLGLLSGKQWDTYSQVTPGAKAIDVWQWVGKCKGSGKRGKLSLEVGGGCDIKLTESHMASCWEFPF